jgi:hypothetical protein
MQTSAENAVLRYADAYQKLYKQMPNDLRALDHQWVIVDGARVHAAELESVTARLLEEHEQLLAQQRSAINRLILWCKQ